jgi:hypothetical protein
VVCGLSLNSWSLRTSRRWVLMDMGFDTVVVQTVGRTARPG